MNMRQISASPLNFLFSFKWCLFSVGAVLLILENCQHVTGHGRLMDPPNRSSLFRFSEFDVYQPEKNWNDMELWCGGITVQYKENGGKCGPCGDNYKDKRPRDNENGGLYGRAIITRNYQPGQVIKVAVDLTQNHRGHFEFSLCPLANSDTLEEEECFAKYPLALADGSGFNYTLPRAENGWYNTTLKLPQGLSSEHAVLRWHYRTANRWDFMNTTNKNVYAGALGHGDQEIFRGCADISIGPVNSMVTPRPPIDGYTTSTIKPPTTPKKNATTTTIATTTTKKPARPVSPVRPSGQAPTMKPPIPIQRPPKPTGAPTVVTSTVATTTTKPTTTTTTTMRPVTTTTVSPVSSSSPPDTSSGSTPQQQQPVRPGHPMMKPPVLKARQLYF